MKKLLNTLYILSEDAYLSLDGENIVILKPDEPDSRFPLTTLENICCFSYKGASPSLMGKCRQENIGLSFFTPRGRFLARVALSDGGNVLLRKQQFRCGENENASCEIARLFILGKVYNGRWLLERAIRDHGMRMDSAAVKQASSGMKQLQEQIVKSTTLDELRGWEGKAASLYFSVIDQLVLAAGDVFSFTERSRRPPLDPMNALLSFLYTLLASDCASALEGVGLDEQVGFLHRDRPGRNSLALDLMEELRPVVADRAALTMINNRIVGKDDFTWQESGAVYLNDEGRKRVLTTWQERKKEVITHPYLQEKVEWGLVPHIQALLLARYLRGDLDEYPPFFWK